LLVFAKIHVDEGLIRIARNDQTPNH